MLGKVHNKLNLHIFLRRLKRLVCRVQERNTINSSETSALRSVFSNQISPEESFNKYVFFSRQRDGRADNNDQTGLKPQTNLH